MTSTVPVTTAEPATALTELTATEAAAQIRAGSLRCSALLEAHLARIDAVDDRVKAFVFIDREALRKEAAQLDGEAAAGKFRGPLHGVTVGLKDVFHVSGMPTLAQSKASDPKLREQDSTIAARFRAAGALILGKLETTEFAASLSQPTTRNPWNLEHNPGGSSSGSGAAVGARMVMAAIGTQTGGSNNRPAAYNGVSGFIASYGRISRSGLHANSWSYDHPGIIARSVEDLALCFSVIGGPDEADTTTIPVQAPPAELNASGVRAPRIGVFREFYEPLADSEMSACVDAAATQFAAAGAEVHDVPMPASFALASTVSRLIGAAEKTVVHAGRMAAGADRFGDNVRRSNLAGTLVPATYYLHAQRIRRKVVDDMKALFDTCDLILLPTATGPEPKGDYTGDPVFLTPWTVMGYPGVNIPGGLSSDGLPLGLQLVAPPMADYELLQNAAWCQSVLGVLPPPPLN